MTPRVSVSIPAFRPEFLDVALATVLGQTLRDFELIISDDSADPDVESVVSKWSDPRIRYVRNPRRGEPGANRDHLLSLATGKYVKFLHDDDFLFPEALERLTEAAERYGAAIVFSSWCVIDEIGRPGQLLSGVGPAEERIFPAEEFFERVIAQRQNFVGGPSHVLVARGALEAIPDPFDLQGVRMRFLTDVVLYTNLAHHGMKFVATGFLGSVYRVHGGQYSQQRGVAYSALLFEFELLMRWAIDHGHLSPARFRESMVSLRHDYAASVAEYPELQSFIELNGAPGPDGRFLGAEFTALLDAAHAQIDDRLVGRRFAGDGGPLAGVESSHELADLSEMVTRLEAQLAQAQSGEAHWRNQFETLRQTRTFRYTRWPRELYESLRHKDGSS